MWDAAQCMMYAEYAVWNGADDDRQETDVGPDRDSWIQRIMDPADAAPAIPPGP